MVNMGNNSFIDIEREKCDIPCKLLNRWLDTFKPLTSRDIIINDVKFACEINVNCPLEKRDMEQ